MTLPIRFLSICSGIEAASVAWEPLGFTPVLYSEIDAFPRAVLAHRFGAHDVARGRPAQKHVPLWSDFTALRMRHLQRLGIDLPEVIVGGTPCQSFSFAGRRKSLADARGNLTLSLVRLVHATFNARRDRGSNSLTLVWENVPGVLNTKDDAFGCFLGALVGGDGPVRLPKRAKRWPNIGMVAGPVARVAWRILNAQYFGLAQRRRRVFVIASFGDGPDPAEILFEPKSLRRDTAPRHKAREDIAGTISARTSGGGGLGTDLDLSGGLIAYGGNNTSGAIDVATAVNAHGGPHGRCDFESETFIVAPQVAHALRGEGFDASEGGTGRGTPIVPVETPICFDPRQSDVLVHGDLAPPLDTKFPGPAICFDTTQITSADNRCKSQVGRPCHPLLATAHPPAVAFEEPFTLAIRGRGETHELEFRQDGLANALLTPNGGRGGIGIGAIATRWQVRRLMPVECARLQGFPDNHSQIPWHGAPAEECPDGPQYKTYGNSMPVEVMAWIGGRLKAALKFDTR
jgi:DNA (cytosine-5)-methyltransferase 1